MTDKPFTHPVNGIVPDQFTVTTTFEDAINRALGVATTRLMGRPGAFPEQYTRITDGAGDGADADGVVVDNTAFGAVIEVTGAGIVATRARPGAVEGFAVVARYLRSVDPLDPSGDSVEFKVRWLDSAFQAIGTATVRTDTLVQSSGVITAVAGVGLSGVGTTLVPPANAVYATPYIQTYGTDGQTRILTLSLLPRAAASALTIFVEPTDDDNTYYPTFVTPDTAGERRPFVDSDLKYNPFTNTLSVENIDVQNIELPPSFVFEPENIPPFDVARTFYVTMDGDDSNMGASLSAPFRTVSRALQAMAALAPLPCVTIVHPGEYLVPPNTVIPPDCALYGYDLRVTKLILSNNAGTAPATGAQRNNIMFLMRNGIKVRGFSITGMRHEALVFDPENQTGTPPTTGYAFAFYPGEFITRSPYIADCTAIHDLTQDEMVLPIDRANANPLVPLGCGNIYADGSVLSGYSPLRSIVVDSFTAVNPNGVGYAIVKNALVQLVSVFTNWSRVGIWSHLGGQVTLANSNNTFGDYAFAATGSRNTIFIPDGSVSGVAVFASSADIITAQTESIVTELMGVGSGSYAANITGWASYSAFQRARTEQDTRILLRELAGDLRSGQERGTQRFLKGLFDWNGEYVWNVTAAPVSQFNQGFDAIAAAINSRLSVGGAQAMVTNLVGLIKTVLLDPAPYRVPFVSVVEYAGQAFSYAGTGVNYNALPFAQRGTGQVPDPLTTIIQWGGGRCYGTFSTERGDTYLGNDLRVDFERSTVEGQAFSRGVQNITLPLIVALGG